MRKLSWSALMMLVAVAGIASGQTQSVVLEDTAPAFLPDGLRGFVDPGKAVITGNGDAHQLLAGLKSVHRFSSAVPGDLQVDAADFYCLIHVVLWNDPVKSAPQTVKTQNWYVYNGDIKVWAQDDFAANKRIFGQKHLALLYIFLNYHADATAAVRYELTVTSKMPANLQHLFAAASAFNGVSPAEASIPPSPYYGIADFNVSYVPSDISVAPILRDEMSDQRTPLADSVAFDNEGKYWWDVSVAVPIAKMGQLSFNNTNNTVTAQNPDKRNVFAVLDLYPHKKDIKSQSFDPWPYLVTGVAVGSQPLHKILVAAGWGPKYAQFYAGALFVDQSSLTGLSAGSMATPAQQAAATHSAFSPQFAFGINLPVREVFQAVTGTTPKTPAPSSPQTPAANTAPANQTPANK